MQGERSGNLWLKKEGGMMGIAGIPWGIGIAGILWGIGIAGIPGGMMGIAVIP